MRDASWGVLGEGEVLLFEARARGWPPRRTAFTWYGMVIAFPYLLGAMFLLLAWWQAPPGATWELGWDIIQVRSSGPNWSSTTNSTGPLFVAFRAELPGGLVLPVPWLVLGLAGAAVCEGLRLASWRSWELALTTRRILTARGIFRRSRQALLRPGGEVAIASGGGAAIEAGGRELLFLPWLGDAADRQALTQALARHEPGPVPPPPRPLLSCRRVAALALLLLLAAVLAVWIAIAPWRVTLEATRPGAPGSEVVKLVVESPSWRGPRVSLWTSFQKGAPPEPMRLGSGSGGGADDLQPGRRGQRIPLTLTRVEADGLPLPLKWESYEHDHRWEGGLLRQRLEVTIEGGSPPGELLVVEGTFHAHDGTELPFLVELSAPGKARVELAPRAP